MGVAVWLGVVLKKYFGIFLILISVIKIILKIIIILKLIYQIYNIIYMWLYNRGYIAKYPIRKLVALSIASLTHVDLFFISLLSFHFKLE